MFKLKPGNVFQKMNTMNRKQAYTWGGIIVVCFIALITLASFMGDADDASFDGMDARGYDLAQMPFVNDEAEQYLLAAKYPDMQNNNATVLYSAAEKEARQEEDAAREAEESDDDVSSYVSARSRRSTGENDSSNYSRSRNRGRGRTGGTGGRTQVNQLSSANMGRANGSGVNSTFGAPRGDFSPYKSQEKGKETPAQLRNQDARKALYQMARGSQAAAGLKDGKSANAKRAMMGGNIQGSEAFSDKGVDLAKLGGLTLDTNAPITSSDLSNLDKDVAEGAKKAEDKKDKEDQSLKDKLLEQLYSGLINLGMQGLGNMMNKGIDAMWEGIAANREGKAYANNVIESMNGVTPSQCTDPGCQSMARGFLGDNYNAWASGDSSFGDFTESNGITKYQMRHNAYEAGGSMPSSISPTRGTDGNIMYIGAPADPQNNFGNSYQEARGRGYSNYVEHHSGSSGVVPVKCSNGQTATYNSQTGQYDC